MINDIHVHFFSSRFLDLLAPDAGGADVVAARLEWDAPGTATELGDRWVTELDRHGVGRAALIASIPGDAASVAEAVAHHPHRFVGFFMHNPAAPAGDAALVRALRDLNMRAICLFPAMHGYRLDDPVVDDVFRAAASHGAAVFVHCGMLTVGVRRKLGLASRFDLRLGDPLALAKTALGYPDVPVLIPHFGAGYFREALMAADQCRTIHFDTSSSNSWIRYHPGLSLQAVFKQGLAVAGPSRVLFGTDSSFFPRGWQAPIFEEQDRILDSLAVADGVRDAVFGDNFDRIFPA
jgi:uncharacterized protein